MTKLLDNVSVDTEGTPVVSDGSNKTLSVWATNFGGGSVTIQGSPDGGVTWITLTYGGNPTIFTSNTIRLIDRIGHGMLTRAILTGSSGAVNVNAQLFQ